MCRILAFAGGESSPGRTTIATGAAVVLGKLGLNTVIVDMNGYESGIAHRLGLNRNPDYTDCFSARGPIDEPALPVTRYVDLLHVPRFDTTATDGAFSDASELEEALSERDFVIVDAPPGTRGDHVGVFRAASEVVLVVLPHEMANVDALVMADDLYRKHGIRRISVLINKVEVPELAEMMCARVEHDLVEVLGIPVAGVGYIPKDNRLTEYVEQGLPLHAFSDDSLIAEAFRYMAERSILPTVPEARGRNLVTEFAAALSVYATGFGLGRVHAQDLFATAENGSAPKEEQIRLFRDIVVEAMQVGDPDAVDFEELFQSVAEIVGRNPREIGGQDGYSVTGA